MPVMTPAKIGDKVKMHYTIYSEDGEVFASTVHEDPLVFTIGDGTEIPGLEKAAVGMKKGEVKYIQLPPEEAYGTHNSDLVSVVDRNIVSGKVNLELGMKLKARTSTGIMKDVTVCNISDTSITVDANHPLAGQEIAVEIIFLERMNT